MVAELKQADDGEQRGEEPPPRRQQPGLAAAGEQCARGERGQQRAGERDALEPDAAGVGVEHREASRPERGAQVDGHGVGGVAEAHRQRVGGVRDRAAAALRDDPDRGAGCRQRDEVPLLRDPGREGPHRSRPSERPEVEGEQHDREDDHRLLGGEAERVQREGRERPQWRRPPQLAKPDVRGGEEEHGGQRVLDLGRPGDGLDAQRMQREETGREGRKPDAPRGAREQQEKQGRRRHVQRDARGVVGGGAGSVRLREHLVEQPGERVPVALVQGGQRPAQVGGAEPRRDAGLGRDEPVVVEWDEIVAQRRREGDERRERDQHRDQGQAPGGGDGSAVGPRRRDHLPEPDSEPAIGSLSKTGRESSIAAAAAWPTPRRTASKAWHAGWHA